MPSFATEVKNELARAAGKRKCCQNAELAALLRMGASVTIGARLHLGLNFITENAAVARRALQLLKSTGQVQTEVTVSRSRKLKKSNSYLLRVAPSPDVRLLMEALGMPGFVDEAVGGERALLRRHCCRKAYLRGAFLGGGTVNRPEAQSHLEFIAGGYAFAHSIVQILKNMDFPVGFTDRKSSYHIYIKDGEEIIDLLFMLGAVRAAEALAVARNLKDVRNQVNRLVNCETANLQKTVSASVEQVACIKKLQAAGELESLPPKLLAAARARLENRDASLVELGELLGISRGAVSSRLKRIKELGQALD